MSTHTPGPWKAFYAPHALGVQSARSDIAWVRFVGKGLLDTDRTEETDRANARLIAAAPDLLAALDGLLSLYRAQWGENEATTAAHNAIAKARGEP